MLSESNFEVVVVGGGPAGATAATELVRSGKQVLLLERGGRIKPCGGAIPPRLIEDFRIPGTLLAARARSARIVSPKGRCVDMPIDGGFVGMVDREVFDPWLRERAAAAGAEVRLARFESFSRNCDGSVTVSCVSTDEQSKGETFEVNAQVLIGADGARSAVARAALTEEEPPPSVAAYHEIIDTPDNPDFNGESCDVWYQGKLSPDFYGWVFPHGDKTSVGVGSANKGFSLRGAVKELRHAAALDQSNTIRCEGAPIPLRVRKRWDDGNNVLVAGDAAGVVAPASGEGIYYAMESGRLVADATIEFLHTGQAKALKKARKRFMRAHGRVFWILGIMQRFWYSSDKRRERFVSMCADPDVKHLTWEAYMHKRLVRARPGAHLRIFVKDLAHLLGLARV